MTARRITEDDARKYTNVVNGPVQDLAADWLDLTRELAEAKTQLAAARGRVDYEAAAKVLAGVCDQVEPQDPDNETPLWDRPWLERNARAIVDAALRAADGGKCETTYLIERGQAVNHAPTVWWCGPGPHDYTGDANLAVRFGTRAEAEQTLGSQGLHFIECARVTEHVFLDRVPPPAARPVGWTSQQIAAAAEELVRHDHAMIAGFDLPEPKWNELSLSQQEAAMHDARLILSRAGSPFAVSKERTARIISEAMYETPYDDLVDNVKIRLRSAAAAALKAAGEGRK
jgi:hypothetical protein